jgi:anti-sigma regulatory factor (Ser/Thr protein kinase)
MEIKTIKKALGATVIEGANGLNRAVDHIYASDLMSDVLAFGKPNSILLTGLASQQSVISAHMAEFSGVVFVRGKKPGGDTAKFAKENDLVILSTPLDMYDACISLNLAAQGKNPAVRPFTPEKPAEELLLRQEFFIEGSDFANAGMTSTEIKSILKKIGFDPALVRRIGISTYEGEMNVVMHGKRAKVTLLVTPESVEISIDDEGKGIPDVEKAMQEGFTTATEEQRAMGFGSGMGLPNIKRNADELEVTSEVGKGTLLRMRFFA